jgi:hypothetical protein
VNRRELIVAAGAACLAPACVGGMAHGRTREAAGLLASLRIGPVRSGAGNHRWAEINSGSVTGTLVQGVVAAGRVDWHADPATGAVEVVLRCSIRGDDGQVWMLDDRSSGPMIGGATGNAALASGPRLHRPTDPLARHPALEGWIDPRRFPEGLLEVRATAA